MNPISRGDHLLPFWNYLTPETSTTNSFLGPPSGLLSLSVSQPTANGGRACGLRRSGHFVHISKFLFLWAETEPIHMPI